MIFFIHIPKTAGTTFYEIVKKNHDFFLKPKAEFLSKEKYLIQKLSSNKSIAIRLPGGYETAPELLNNIVKNINGCDTSKIDFIGGHVGYGVHRLINEKVDYISFLREPKKRLISDFNEHHKNGRFFYKKLQNSNFDFNIYLELLLETGLDNLLTRQLAGPHDFFLQKKMKVSPDIFNKALSNSEKIIFLDMEKFDESLFFFNKKFNWKNTSYIKKNVSTKKNEKHNYDKKLLNEIIKYDLRLYDKIQQKVVNNSDLNFLKKIKLQIDNFLR